MSTFSTVVVWQDSGISLFAQSTYDGFPLARESSGVEETKGWAKYALRLNTSSVSGERERCVSIVLVQNSYFSA